jgi:predicted amidohydrolase YtcJ
VRLTLGKIVPVAITSCFLGLMALAQQSTPDLMMFNGKVFTSNSSQPYAEALAIRGERIVAVGASKEIVALAGKETKRIDLGGRTVIPGINDAHYHLGFNVSEEDLQINSNDPSWQEINGAVSSTVAKVPKGTWITGGFGPTVLEDPQATGAGLDALAPDKPVLLSALGGHRWIVNTGCAEKTRSPRRRAESAGRCVCPKPGGWQADRHSV